MVPIEKAFNSWWWLFLVLPRRVAYLRFTLPCLPVVRTRPDEESAEILP